MSETVSLTDKPHKSLSAIIGFMADHEWDALSGDTQERLNALAAELDAEGAVLRAMREALRFVSDIDNSHKSARMLRQAISAIGREP